MAQVRITGEVPNLRMLLDDLNSSQEFSIGASTSIIRVEQDSHRLGNAELVTLIIEVGVGVASSAVYDLIKLAVLSARRRGTLTTEGLGATQSLEQRPEEETAEPDAVDSGA
ncbi:hypothetical protein OG819_55955 [Streptomyces sp. NBC_01549]|uniref:hypothetical protein n=1 Tax=Streptomyces sp. NBC_01549 TaxID=2975874 RepID=UPI00225B6CA9|nr:hypothetical protein [Streptomyces sp. NBC_01549]MCX4598447.1 hypothetical protein [Streptomyces sp. NBC_01549]